jgi:hypothetical protein
MRSSEGIEKLAEALCAAQGEMGGAVKGSANPFFKSSYADLTSVIKAIKEPCSKHGLSYVQLPHRDGSSIGVVTRLIHTSGQWLENEFTLPMVKGDPQAAGSAVTYARRYALQALFGIPAVDDDAEAAVLRGSQQPTVKDEYAELVDQLADSVEAIKTGIQIGDLVMAKEAWDELTEEEKIGIWKAPSKGGVFTTEERSVMKSTEFRTATGE